MNVIFINRWLQNPLFCRAFKRFLQKQKYIPQHREFIKLVPCRTFIPVFARKLKKRTYMIFINTMIAFINHICKRLII